MLGTMDIVLNIRGINQIKAAVRQVFDSWDSPRAVEYRKVNKIPPELGTAAVVQAMVFGDKDSNFGN